VASDGTICIPNSVKIGPMVQKLNMRDTYTDIMVIS